VFSYFRGSRDQWKTGLSTYASLVYRDLWPGIDLVFTGSVNRLKYTFLIHPGADPDRIKLAYRGATAVRLASGGELDVSTPVGGFRDAKPYAYQDFAGQRIEVAAAYAMEPEARGGVYGYGFRLDRYDRSRPLVLDPAMLVYAGYIGGALDDSGRGIAVDGAGNAYVTGFTGSSEATFPVTGGPDLTFSGNRDAFVVKVNPAGTALVYAGYIGGTGDDLGLGIAVDSVGNAYITGQTTSAQNTFPVTGGPDLTFGGVADAFVAKVNAAGTGLVYAGYIGGNADDAGLGIGVDSAGSAYVTGYAKSDQTTFPVTLGPDLTHNGDFDAFVAKVNAPGTALLYAGYIGGPGNDQGHGIAVDSGGNAYVTGPTSSPQGTFPVTGGPDLTFNGIFDAFVAKVNGLGTALVYAGYIGGAAHDQGEAIAVDSAGNAYVTGFTASSEATFPVTVGPDLTFGGVNDAFVAKVNALGTALVYAGYIGGTGDDQGAAITVDSAGNAYVTGFTRSSEATFPVTRGPDLTFNGNLDAFVAKISDIAPPATLTLAPPTDTNPVGTQHCVTATVQDAVGNPTSGVTVRFTVTGSINTTGSATTDANGQATFCYTGPTATGADTITAYADTDTDNTQDPGEPAGTAAKTWVAGAPATLILEPPTDTNPVGTQHCVTATVQDAFGNPTPGVTVRFAVSGSTTTGSATTDANGQATFCYTGPPLPGADTITAYADTDADNTQDPGEPTGAATKMWVLPVTTPLCEIIITKGGRITANNGDRATFGGNAQSSASGATKGQEQYQDHGPAQPQKVHSINVLAIVCEGTTRASIYGRATINGSGSFFYRIIVQDLAEPGVGRDTYGILLQTGYDSGEKVLEGGNVQIRRR
jgi:hypothetical protein